MSGVGPGALRPPDPPRIFEDRRWKGALRKVLRALRLFLSGGGNGCAARCAAVCAAGCGHARWGRGALTLMGGCESGWGGGKLDLSGLVFWP